MADMAARLAIFTAGWLNLAAWHESDLDQI